MPSYKRTVSILILILVVVLLQTGSVVSAHSSQPQYKTAPAGSAPLASVIGDYQNYKLIISDLHSVQVRYIYV